MTEYTARCVKLSTYRDIKIAAQASDDLIKNRTETWQMGAIYDYEYMIDEAVIFVSQLALEDQAQQHK